MARHPHLCICIVPIRGYMRNIQNPFLPGWCAHVSYVEKSESRDRNQKVPSSLGDLRLVAWPNSSVEDLNGCFPGFGCKGGKSREIACIVECLQSRSYIDLIPYFGLVCLGTALQFQSRGFLYMSVDSISRDACQGFFLGLHSCSRRIFFKILNESSALVMQHGRGPDNSHQVC